MTSSSPNMAFTTIADAQEGKEILYFYLDVVTYAGGNDGKIAYRRKLGYRKHEILACTTAAKRRKII